MLSVLGKILTKALVQLQHRHEGGLGDFHLADLAHPLLAGLLLFEQFAFTRDVTAITLGGHIFAHLAYRFAGDDLGADGGLDGLLRSLTSR